MRLVVGRISRAHGVTGEVVVDVRTDDPVGRFAPGVVLATQPPGAGPLTVGSVRPHSGRLLLRFAGVADRTAAEALRGVRLLADEALEPDDEDAYYDHQLEGLRVRTADGTVVGSVAEVLHQPAQDLLVVRTTTDEVLVPFVAAIVPVVDLTAGEVVLDPPPGLLDPDEAVEA